MRLITLAGPDLSRETPLGWMEFRNLSFRLLHQFRDNLAADKLMAIEAPKKTPFGWSVVCDNIRVTCSYDLLRDVYATSASAWVQGPPDELDEPGYGAGV